MPAGLAAGSSLAEALPWAVTAASLSVGRIGTFEAYPTTDEIRDALHDAPEAARTLMR